MQVMVLFPLRLMNVVLLEAAEEQGKMNQETSLSSSLPWEHFSNGPTKIPIHLALRCPFCNAEEEDRVSAVDHSGRKLFLIMFDCPFTFRFYEDEMVSDQVLQSRLYDWRTSKGDEWLEALGPLMKARELEGVERYKKSHSAN
jgi:hypothetical protein